MADYETCDKCGGSGWLVHPDAEKEGAPDNITCDKCGGDGFV